MIWEACFREAVRLERSVGWVVVYLVSPIAERLEKGPTMGGGGQWGLREEEKIRGFFVQHRNDVDHRGAVGSRFLSIYGDECEG